MYDRGAVQDQVLDLKAGEWVEVRSREAILSTLDERGCFENLPFMPEMLQYCGKRFRVSKRADKTCENILGWSIRRMEKSVHLEGLRCDGEGHGGCQAGCLIFWKEVWLKRVEGNVVSSETLLAGSSLFQGSREGCSVASILVATSRTDPEGQRIYSCQATDLIKYTSYMAEWDPRQYVRDLRSGNLSTGLGKDSIAHRSLEQVLGVMEIVRTLTISLFNRVQQRRLHWKPQYPFVEGSAEKTPAGVLDLRPGELVEVRSKEEIMATLDKQNRNRGLLFDGEMLRYCGHIYRVFRRVHRIIDEKTGKMLDMKYPCIILEGVACRSDYHRLCPRAIYHYWRENWLKRAVAVAEPPTAKEIAETCEKC